MAQPVAAKPVQTGGALRSIRQRAAASSASVFCGLLLRFGGSSFDVPQREVVSQPPAAQRALAPTQPLTGLSSELLSGDSASDERSRRRAERLERRKARKEAALAKRAAAREARARKAEERREAREARREARKAKYAAAAEARREAREARREAREARREAHGTDHEDAAQARREAREARREARKAKHAEAAEARREAREARKAAREAKREAARERYAARMEARREAAEARREAKEARREEARARREEAKAQRGAASEVAESSLMTESTPVGSRGSATSTGNSGLLRITSLPWAEVYVDGRKVGYTPQLGIVLAAGDHDVRLINPAFRMKKTLRVRIAEGQQVSRREFLEE